MVKRPGALMKALHHTVVDFLYGSRRAMSAVSPSFGEKSNYTICHRIYDVISSTPAPPTLVQVNNEQQDVTDVCSRMNGA